MQIPDAPPTMRSLIRDAVADIRQRIRARPDTEFQQALIRVVIGLGFYGFFCSPYAHLDGPSREHAELVSLAFVAVSTALLVVVAMSKYAVPVRRVLGMVLDFSTASYLMIHAGESGSPLLVVYLWVTLGNGLRYETKYLFISAAFGISGFVGVMLLSDYWQKNEAIGLGFLLCMIAVPAYTYSLTKRLHGAVKQAQAANAAKSQFLANMTHELRTPLNGVIGVADLLTETPLNREQKELTGVIRSSADTLLKLIENVLDISRIEAGKQMVESVDYDLHRLVNRTVLMLEPQASKKGLVLASHIAPQTPFQLRGDARHVRQVLINLIGNAIKFTEHGRVDVYVRPQGLGTKLKLRFEVVDTGIGIAEHAQSRIFESFNQADASITRRFGGSGLGTAISKQLVELMGGRIAFSSRVGEGSTFWFELPAIQTEEQDATQDLDKTLVQLQVGVLANAELRVRLADLIRGWAGQVVPVSTPISILSGLTDGTMQDLRAVLVERQQLGAQAQSFIQLLQDCPRKVPVILVDNDLEHSVPDADWLQMGYSAVLKAPINPTLLFNTLHAAATETELPENVVSLAEHFQAKAGGHYRLRILVAEDNPVNQRVIRGLLETAGHEVVVARDGEEALSLLETSREKFSAAILDMHMPKFSGPEVAKRWRFMEQEHLPLIMLTADATQEAQQICTDAGVDAFLTKPVNSRSLMEVLAKLTSQPKADVVPANLGQQRKQTVVDQDVLRELAELAGGLDFVRDLIGGFKEDAERSYVEAESALSVQDYGAWKDHLHMLKGGASDVGCGLLAAACIDAERIKPYEIGQAVAREKLTAVRAALDSAKAALDDYLASQRSAVQGS
ncbi:MAG: ATP-binding protein [Thiobacillaceae bacterium]